MGIMFSLVGLVLIITGARDTYAQLGAQLQKDFTGQGNFTFWIAAIGLVGALGYVPALRTFSHYFMALVLLALLLSHKGFFANLSSALQKGPVAAAPTSNPVASPNAQSPISAAALPGMGSGALSDWFTQMPSFSTVPGSWANSIFGHGAAQ